MSPATPSRTRPARASPAFRLRIGRCRTGSWTLRSRSCCCSSQPPTRASGRSSSGCTGVLARCSARSACPRAGWSSVPSHSATRRPLARRGPQARPGRRDAAPGARWARSSTGDVGRSGLPTGRSGLPGADQAVEEDRAEGDVGPGLGRLDHRLGSERARTEVHDDVGNGVRAVMGEVVEEQIPGLEVP